MNRRTSAGYSLIEVLVAIAITSVVLLTVVTLFYVGKRNIYSGKERSYAVAAGTRALEDLSAMTGANLRTNFNIDNNTTLGKVTLDKLPPGSPGADGSGNMSIDQSITRDSTKCTYNTSTKVWENCTDDTNGFIGRWMTEISPNGNPSERLANPVIGLIITPKSPEIVAQPITTAKFTKVRLYIRWDEGGGTAHRYIFFDTTKVF
jgi:prepilin-type N-terminal cleavage/methylation domain-containing protein